MTFKYFHYIKFSFRPSGYYYISSSKKWAAMAGHRYPLEISQRLAKVSQGEL